MKIISVNIQKGGCGKTTTCQMIGEILGKYYDKKVLCIDADPQCNLTTVSGINIMDCQKHNLYTLLHEESKADECIVESDYYDVIAGSLLLASADVDFYNTLARESLLKEAIQNLDYDVVLIDTPPSLGLLSNMSLICADMVIIPTECSYLSMVGLNQLYGRILAVKKRLNPTLEILGILLIKYSEQAKLNRAVLDNLLQMSEQMNTRVFDTKIRETVRIREAQGNQKAIIDWKEDCTAVEDYKELVSQIASYL